MIDSYWRPVRESNPCRRREREAIHCNLKELGGMDGTFTALERLFRTRYWTFNGRVESLLHNHGRMKNR
jgi:hypothetical protein